MLRNETRRPRDFPPKTSRSPDRILRRIVESSQSNSLAALTIRRPPSSVYPNSSGVMSFSIAILIICRASAAGVLGGLQKCKLDHAALRPSIDHRCPAVVRRPEIDRLLHRCGIPTAPRQRIGRRRVVGVPPRLVQRETGGDAGSV